jgi:hypothetical protein
VPAGGVRAESLRRRARGTQSSGEGARVRLAAQGVQGELRAIVFEVKKRP